MRDADTAFYWSLWRAILAVIIATVLVACRSASATDALLIGANVALLYCFSQMLSARAAARMRSDIPILRFAKAASVVAIALCGAALVI